MTAWGENPTTGKPTGSEAATLEARRAFIGTSELIIEGSMLLASLQEISARLHRVVDPLFARPEALAMSEGHLGLGVASYWAGSWLMKKITPNRWSQAAGIVAGGSMANLAVEKAQAMMGLTPDFLAPENIPDTARDYAFMLTGMGMAAGLRAWRQRSVSE